jgi:hypothetical protein
LRVKSNEAHERRKAPFGNIKTRRKAFCCNETEKNVKTDSAGNLDNRLTEDPGFESRHGVRFLGIYRYIEMMLS